MVDSTMDIEHYGMSSTCE